MGRLGKRAAGRFRLYRCPDPGCPVPSIPASKQAAGKRGLRSPAEFTEQGPFARHGTGGTRNPSAPDAPRGFLFGGTSPARPQTAAPRTCVRGVHPPALLRQASPPFTARVSWSAGRYLCLPDDPICLFNGRDVNGSCLADVAPSPRAGAASVAAGPLRGSMITAGQSGAALRPTALDRLTPLSGRAR